MMAYRTITLLMMASLSIRAGLPDGAKQQKHPGLPLRWFGVVMPSTETRKNQLMQKDGYSCRGNGGGLILRRLQSKKLKGIAFLVVSDLFRQNKWKPGFSSYPSEGIRRLREFSWNRSNTALIGSKKIKRTTSPFQSFRMVLLRRHNPSWAPVNHHIFNFQRYPYVDLFASFYLKRFQGHSISRISE